MGLVILHQEQNVVIRPHTVNASAHVTGGKWLRISAPYLALTHTPARVGRISIA